jgi:hypothetical protein
MMIPFQKIKQSLALCGILGFLPLVSMCNAPVQINRHIFGQFAEHLGTGIYGGIWVGPDSEIPNTRGYPQRCGGSLKGA